MMPANLSPGVKIVAGLNLTNGYHCCYTAPVNPCNICPHGATVAGGDDYVPDYDGTSVTCLELIDQAKEYESGSFSCGLYEIDKESCCPPATTTPASTSVPMATPGQWRLLSPSLLAESIALLLSLPFLPLWSFLSWRWRFIIFAKWHLTSKARRGLILKEWCRCQKEAFRLLWQQKWWTLRLLKVIPSKPPLRMLHMLTNFTYACHFCYLLRTL